MLINAHNPFKGDHFREKRSFLLRCAGTPVSALPRAFAEL